MDFYSYYPWVGRPYIPYYKPNMEIVKYEQNRPIYPSPRIFPFLPGTYYRMELMPKTRGWTTQSLNSRWVFNLKPEPKRLEIKQIGPPPTGTWTRSPSDNFEFKPTIYPSPSGSLNGVYGQKSQIISLGLKNLTKQDVTFTNKGEGIVYHMDDNRNKVQLISVKPKSNPSLENVKKSIMYVHSVQKIEIKSPLVDSPVKIKVPSVEEMKISSEHVFKTVKEEASCLTLMAPNPSLSTTFSQAESEEFSKQKSSMRFESNHSFEKLNKVLNSKHIEEVTVTILNMFTHHESEDGEDTWNPDNIPLLGIDSDINIKYLLHLLSRNGQELSRTLTRRQKRDLAGMIDSQVARFKLTGLTWATMCEKIISGIDGKVAILQKLIPCFASMTKDGCE